MFNPDIKIREIDKSNLKDIAFITVLCRTFGADMQLDDHDLCSDKFIQMMVNFPSLRVITYKDEYIGFVWLDGFMYNLRAYIHGLVNQFDKRGKKTHKYYLIFTKNRVMEQVLEYYFKFYDRHPKYNLNCIEAEVPEYLQNKFVNGVVKDLATRKMLIDAGFVMITNQPRRNAFRKNGKPCSSFLYQIQKNWLISWLETQREYIAMSLAISELNAINELSTKYRKRPESIEKMVKQKKLRRK